MARNSSFKSNPRAAVAVIVTLGDRVLFGQRRLLSGGFEWQLPGGWINDGEVAEKAARREVEEETALKLAGIEFVAITNNKFSRQNHSISLCFEAECCNPEELTVKEPEKCLGWHWKKWQEVEQNLFLPLANLKKSDYRPFIRDKRGIGLSIP